MLKNNWIVLIIAIIALCLTNTATAEDLATAIAAGKINATFNGTGASSGSAIMVTVKKHKKRADNGNIELTVSPGMRLNSGNSGEQDMVIARVQGIDMGGGMYSPSSTIEVSNSPQTYVLEAYCAEFAKDNPSDNNGFSISSTIDPKLACILTKAAHLSVPTKQAAVWIYTDQATFDHVNEKLEISKSDWNAATTVVKKCLKKK